MNNLIIGHRGFVGQNLSRYIPDSLGVGRQEIKDLAGYTFSNIYCAAPQAKKWWANQNPVEDKIEIENLLSDCQKINCKHHLMLVRTIDVYDNPINVNELSIPSPKSQPYGLHRYELERECINLYGDMTRIVRLPALIGQGLKKNIIYDLLNDNNISNINPNSSFQWFNLDHISTIIDLIKDGDHGQILNVASEPISTQLILDSWFKDAKDKLDWTLKKFIYDVHTVYAEKNSPYLYSASNVIDFHLRPFIELNLKGK